VLPLQNLSSDLPVEHHQLPVHRQRRPYLRRADALLQVVEESGVAIVVRKQGGGIGHDGGGCAKGNSAKVQNTAGLGHP